MVKCLLRVKCKQAGNPALCGPLCYAFLKLQGESGSGGIWGLAGIPKAYTGVSARELPFEQENPVAYAAVQKYCVDVLGKVAKGCGLYLFSIPQSDNAKGTGTGKTTAAVAILNEFLVARTIEHVTKQRRIEEVPALFVNASKYQNSFNAQFRGTPEMQQTASAQYYRLKERMLKAELLVLDDIGVREATEAYRSEFYEVIDGRAIDEMSTIYTSNVPLTDIAGLLDDRIASRIEGAAIPISFRGVDHRKAGLY
ncbi:DNA replication protein [Heliobacillus mobilis]|uniref:DNA replication protein n=1 Tax=Heliobacterium mobile TaxID=28064 RepID=A0A6I3SBY6_HELMO|nr:ATP-binding protein [Heliobacterium mobile]MTV47862.1 DNA replication protein [Heliobacterium mobile]